jgi:hypothetical protein
MRRTAICWVAMVLLSAVLGFCQATATKHTENPGFPRVVAKISRWGKTGRIGATVLFTPKHFGVYRVSGVVVVTSQIDNGVGVLVDFRDGGGSQQLTFEAGGPPGDYSFGPFVFRDLIGAPIQLFVDSGETGKYNLFVVIEQIM